MFVTYAMLRKAHACDEESNRFRELFPDGVEVTEAVCVKHAREFDWAWGTVLLSYEGQEEFRRAERVAQRFLYLEEVKLAEDYYALNNIVKRMHPLTTDYQAYADAMVPVTEAHNAASAPLRATYRRSIARAYAAAAQIEEA